jgi:hypothetical protein
MKWKTCLAVLLLGSALCLPGSAQLRYFGYHGGADDDLSLGRTRGFTNFAYIVAPERLASPFVRDRVSAMARSGLKAIIDLEHVLWCDDEQGHDALCRDWSKRWRTWKKTNAGILSRNKVLAFAVLDEPFLSGVDMPDYEWAVRKVKTDFPWAKVLLVEAACAVEGRCGATPVTSFEQYSGTLPGVDWVGLDAYGIHPATDPLYQSALARLKSRFPDKKRIYVLDGFWEQGHSAVAPDPADMGPIAREWYDVGRDDPDAVLLGVFAWGPYPPGTTTSKDLPCNVLLEHIAIGREVTGKLRPSPACL